MQSSLAPHRYVLTVLQRTPHDWASCHFAHPGEKAKRRNIRTHSYDCEMCPEIVKVRSVAALRVWTATLTANKPILAVFPRNQLVQGPLAS